MTDHIDPVAATAAIESSYRKYLLTTMRTNDPAINEAITRGFEASKRPFVSGPIVEASPQYRAGETVRELVSSGLLSEEWLKADFGGQVVLDRPLYVHQVEAVTRVASQGRNVVVATGTGSGKTEAFLIPIVEELFRQARRGALAAGVRALLLYPMNALANDQLKRLRSLLKASPEITFGRYTGETPNTRQEGIERLRAAVPDAEILPNEFLGREEMQDRPPHLLLTNYAMLEYLLLRPADSSLFDNSGENGWRFLVLDEVHAYDGAMGIEIGMLLRRVQDRVGRGPGTLQGIATSATVGGRADCGAVARFASELFNLPFEWVVEDATRQDVVLATEYRPALPNKSRAGAAMDETVADNAPAFATDAQIPELLRALWKQPLTLDEVAATLRSTKAQAGEVIGDLCRRTLDDDSMPLLRARFHTFIRATDGVDVCLREHADGLPRAFLEPRRHCPDCGESAAVAELTTCRRCNQWHLRGRTGENGSLVRAVDIEDADERIRYLAPELDPGPENEDGSDDGPPVANPFGPGGRAKEVVFLCFGCLGFQQEGRCGCGRADVRRVVLASRTDAGSIRCVNCNAPASQRGPRRMRLGTDAPPAVVASSLFDALPRGGERPRFLSFADSRQDAAFFAPYLERTYGKVARRRLLLSALRRGWALADNEGVRLEDLVPLIRKTAASEGFFVASASALQQSGQVRAWVLAELTSVDSRQSLAGVGLAGRRLACPPGWTPPKKLLESPWSLTPDEAWLVVEALLRTLLDDQCVAFPEGVNPADEVFSPRNKEFGFRLSQPSKTQDLSVLGWAPAAGANSRSDFADRLLARLHPEWSRETRRASVVEALQGLWAVVTGPGQLKDYVTSAAHPQLGTYYQLNSAYWELVPPADLFQCGVCGQIEHSTLRGVCPSYRCSGALVPALPGVANDHYRTLYESPSGGRLVAEEHTAQWAADEAARVQGRFTASDGDINVLSCSTTFELGVDVGELEAVLLRNVPPTASNYVQRAGRAGRRSSSVGFIVTFAQLRPHDTQSFDRARELVAGRVPPPRVPARNTRIIRRHMHSVAFSRYFRRVVEAGEPWPRRAGQFFEATEQGSHCDRFRSYLATHEPMLLAEVRRIVPRELHEELGIDEWAWAHALAESDPLSSPLARAEAETLSDITLYQQLLEDAAASHNGTAVNRYKAVLNTVRNADLLQTLAARNVLPKYGFPVDVVPLRTTHIPIREARTVSLDRDLRIAVSEYAPGSGVVAAKKLWVSTGVHLLPNRGLPERSYAVCQACNRFYREEGLSACPQCGDRVRSGTLVEPVFGFVSRDPDVKPLGEDRPQRLYSTRILFHEFGDPTPRRELLPGRNGAGAVAGRFSRQGSLSVVNDARGRHFRLCHTCGYARIGGTAGGSHRHPTTGRSCGGTLQTADLGHTFTSDIAEFVVTGLARTDTAARASLLAALLEGARRTLGVSHGDIDGVGYLEHGQPIVAIFDDVPGGAGLARESFDRIREIVERAYDVCATCTCGENSSCYGCLRSYRNQHEHEALDRTAALEILSLMSS